MQEYLDNGARLGWLIAPLERVVYVYRPGAGLKRFTSADTLTSSDVLPGFSCPVAELFRNV